MRWQCFSETLIFGFDLALRTTTNYAFGLTSMGHGLDGSVTQSLSLVIDGGGRELLDSLKIRVTVLVPDIAYFSVERGRYSPNQ